MLQVADLQGKLTILYQPQRHPEAHARLLEFLGHAGLQIEEYSSASHPTEMQMLVKEGYGVVLVREGRPLDEELTTRLILGVDWSVDIAIAHHRDHHPKTVPIVIRQLRKMLQPTHGSRKKKAQLTIAPALAETPRPEQLWLLR